jgi:hypothetical protein
MLDYNLNMRKFRNILLILLLVIIPIVIATDTNIAGRISDDHAHLSADSGFPQNDFTLYEGVETTIIANLDNVCETHFDYAGSNPIVPGCNDDKYGVDSCNNNYATCEIDGKALKCTGVEKISSISCRVYGYPNSAGFMHTNRRRAYEKINFVVEEAPLGPAPPTIADHIYKSAPETTSSIQLTLSDFETVFNDVNSDIFSGIKLSASLKYGTIKIGPINSPGKILSELFYNEIITVQELTTGVYYIPDSENSAGASATAVESDLLFKVYDGEDWSTMTKKVYITLTQVRDNPVLEDLPSYIWEEDAHNTHYTDLFNIVTDKYISDLDTAEYNLDYSLIMPPDAILDCKISSFSIYCKTKPNQHGDATFQLTASDGDGADTKAITFTITPMNDAPIYSHGTGTATLSVDEAGDKDFDIPIEDIDEGDEVTYTLTKTPEFGAVNINNEISKREDNNYETTSTTSNTDTFTIEGCDKSNACKSVTYTVTIAGENSPPTSQAIIIVTSEDTQYTFTDISKFPIFDDENDGISLIEIQPYNQIPGDLNGIITYDSNTQQEIFEVLPNKINTLKYTPNQYFSGTDIFYFRVKDDSIDGELYSNNYYKATISVTEVNNNPIMESINPKTTNEDTEIEIQVRAQDVDNTLNELTLTPTPKDTSLVTNDNIEITRKSDFFLVKITPQENQYGDVTIEFTVTDEDGATDTEDFQLTINSVNDKPTSQDTEITIERSADIVFDQSYFPFSDVEDQQTPTKIKLVGYPEKTVGMVYFKNKLASIGLELIPSEIGELVFKSQNTGTETIDYILTDSDSESTEIHSIKINIEESRFGPNSQFCEHGGLRILNSNYCCKGGFIPKPDLFDVSLTAGDIDACQSYENQPPKAKITIPDTNVTVNDTITFDGSTSRDPDGIIVNYLWNFGDGSEDLTGEIVTHKMESDCTVTACDITLTVTDNFDNTDETSIQLLLAQLNETNDSTIIIIQEEEPEEEEDDSETADEETGETSGGYDWGAPGGGEDEDDGTKGSAAGWLIILAILAIMGGIYFAFKKGLFNKKKEPEPIDLDSETFEAEEPVKEKKDTGKMSSFISDQQDKGLSNEEIRQKLLGKGLSDDEVDKHMNASKE